MWFEIKNTSQYRNQEYEMQLIIERAKKVGINIKFDKECNRLDIALTAIKNISYKLTTCKDIRNRLKQQEKKKIYTDLNMSKDTFYRTLKAMNKANWPDESPFSNLYHQKEQEENEGNMENSKEII